MNNIIERTWRQGGMVFPEDMRGTAFTAEDGAHTFIISGVDLNGDPINLSGTVAASLIRPDGTTTPMTGTISGGKASVTLSAECYGVGGRASLTIFLTSGGQKVAIFGARISIDRSSTAQASPGVAADVVDLVNRIDAAVATIPASYTALMAAIAPDYSSSSTYPKVGSFVWYSGTLYRSKVAIETAESWTADHWKKATLGDDLNDDITSLKSALDSKVHYLATDLTERVYPVWESGGIDDAGENEASNYVRTKDYISKESISLWNLATHTGTLYVHRYNYADGVYTYLGYNQRVSTGTFTSWLKNLSGTHFRFEHQQPDVNYPNTWMTLCYKTTLTAMQNAVNAVQNFNVGALGKDARTLIIDILRSGIFTSDVADKITMLNRYLIASGELIITQTGKRYNQTGGIRDYEYTCITEFYPIEDGATSVVIYMAIDDLTQLGNPFVLQRKEDDTLNAYLNMSNSGRQNAEYQWSIANLSAFVGFTLNTASAQKSYAYFLPSGNLVFAGAESTYAGLKNIGQKGANA